jgi:cyclase
MPLPRLIPCLDVADGRVVKGVNFENLRDVGDPVSLGAAYSDAGADELVFLDITATLDKRAAAVATAARVAEQVTIPFTFGGGIRTVDDACAVLEAGADKVSVNSAALARPQLIEELAGALGSQAVVVAIDSASNQVFSHAGTRGEARDTLAWATECEERGAGELLVTSIDRDGTRSGFDTALLHAISARVAVPVIASGGAAGPADFVAAVRDGGADAVLAASIFHRRIHSIGAVKEAMAAAGLPVRLVPGAAA